MGRVVGNQRYSLRVGATSSWKNANMLNAKSLISLNVRCGDVINAHLRPMKGDHIHYAFGIYILEELLDPLYDQGWVSETYADEGLEYPVTFADLLTKLNETHITQLNPHFGIHGGAPYW